jgi:phosphotransferase system enzyme I (PtsI)
VRILVPMVATREEILAIKRRITKLAAALRAEGHALAEQVPVGAMIEVPAAALALDSFIDQVDFLSVGTNDLVQYLLAADRNNEAVSELYSPLHPAVLRLLAQVIETARARNVPLSVCGEIAGDPRMTPLLLALGLEEFSLHPATLLEVRRAVRASNLSELRAQAPKLLAARDLRGIERWLAQASAPQERT